MGLALDTSALVHLERHGRALLEGIEAAPPDLLLPGPVVAELWVGVELADSPDRRLSRRRGIEFLLARVQVLPFDATVAPTYAAVYVHLRSQGTPIPAMDLAIASLALHHHHALLVGPADEHHFRRVPGLEVQVLPG